MPRTELLLELEENGDLDLTRVQLAFEEPRACRVSAPIRKAKLSHTLCSDTRSSSWESILSA